MAYDVFTPTAAADDRPIFEDIAIAGANINVAIDLTSIQEARLARVRVLSATTGVLASNGSDVRISQSYFGSCGKGVDIDSTQERVLVADSQFNFCSTAGVEDSGTRTLVEGCQFDQTPLLGVSPIDPVYVGNTIEGSLGVAGIKITGATRPTVNSNHLFDVNTTPTDSGAIHIDGTGAALQRGATVVGNAIDATNAAGIYISDHDDIEVSNNKVTRHRTHGIEVNDCNKGDVLGNLSDPLANATTSDGIHLSGTTTEIKIDGNVLVPDVDGTSSRYAINLAAATVDDIYVLNNTWEPIADWATGEVNITAGATAWIGPQAHEWNLGAPSGRTDTDIIEWDTTTGKWVMVTKPSGGGTSDHDSLTGVSIDDHHARDHASTHSDGGADEIDAADLASGAATDGHVLTADGAGGAAWEAVTGGGGGGTAAMLGLVGTTVKKTTTTTLPNAGAYQTWDAVETGQDDGSMWASGNPTRLTAQADGWHFLNAGFRTTTNNPSGDFWFSFRVNGTTTILASSSVPRQDTGANFRAGDSASAYVYLDADDYVEVFFGQDSGGNLTMENAWFQMVGPGGINTVYKTADESVTSSTTQQDDDHLTVGVAANATYIVEAALRVEGATAGDFKAGLSAPTGATGWSALIGPGIGATTFSDHNVDNQSSSLALAGFAGMLGAGNEVLVILKGYVAVGGTAGNVALSWAQRVSDATATKVLTGSWMRVEKVA